MFPSDSNLFAPDRGLTPSVVRRGRLCTPSVVRLWNHAGTSVGNGVGPVGRTPQRKECRTRNPLGAKVGIRGRSSPGHRLGSPLWALGPDPVWLTYRNDVWTSLARTGRCELQPPFRWSDGHLRVGVGSGTVK